MPKVTIYTKDYCPYCQAAKRLLEDKQVAFEEINASKDPSALTAVIKKTNHQTVPQIFIGDDFVGGFQELQALDESGQLDKKLGIS
ncbi:MAG: glutaredoxin 3 [Candidatus Omnitrophica bacterium CG11_big_fil_rev_8_21_14_0_20_45_26]|uniref:Glutaredoxin n=1 Tax=Candidatus Abzuiibacterium crystallinum TaxID=1974748 RepID=A0A2H0LMB3_9BACT|nr:MAG: glutaredoxin 3 [Candidatus Omnitrophica bacterium CG11_big_fil_rev_8_21_14_0_20_45_26]PIW63761.1 MAG: glutaredoxin 3 [Candidatus Omnitrophica bacterium CG12_big_fil_rev_8_21_14_0_65_45_16]